MKVLSKPSPIQNGLIGKARFIKPQNPDRLLLLYYDRKIL